MTTADDDPFAPAAKSWVSRGRYMLPRLDGSHKPYGYTRVTTLVKAHTDQYALRVWELTEVLRGLALRPELYETLVSEILADMDREDLKRWVEGFIERAKDASGGNRGKNFGNQRHGAVEIHHAGHRTDWMSSDTQEHLRLYVAALERQKLRALPGMQERIVLVEALEACGKLDNVLEDLETGALSVGDLKTQKRFWTWLEVTAQQACYANACAMWEPTADGGRWVDMPKVRRDVAHILWMPRETPDGQPRVDIYDVDIEAGWKSAQLAYQIVRDRSAGKSTRAPLGWPRVTRAAQVERFAARFASCATMDEGRTLVAEARQAGVWGVVLSECAKTARARIAEHDLTGTKK